MAKLRVNLAADTWTELDVATYGQHFTVLSSMADLVIQLVSDDTAPGTDPGDTVTANQACEVILAQDFAGSVWVKSTAGGVLEVKDHGAKMVLVGQTVAGT